MNASFSKALLLAAVLFFFPLTALASPPGSVGDEPAYTSNIVLAQNDDDYDEFLDELDDDFGEDLTEIFDPLEPFNRAMFHVNDKLYFYFMKPVAQGYNFVLPEPVRSSVRKFFKNVRTPVRFLNAFLQGKMEKAGTELVRFTLNSTIGVAGFMDPARDWWEIYPTNEDTGQTLGFFGMGTGFYLYWPILGPSSVRGTLGFVGDSALDPASYITPGYISTGIKAYDTINTVSLNIGFYEDIKKEALDPYIFIRDAYFQHRESKVKE